MSSQRDKVVKKEERMLAAIERGFKDAKFALTKWAKGYRYAPQAGNYVTAMTELSGIARRSAERMKTKGQMKDESVGSGGMGALMEGLRSVIEPEGQGEDGEAVTEGSADLVKDVARKAADLKGALGEFSRVVQQVEHDGATITPAFKKLLKELSRLEDQMEFVQYRTGKYVQ